MTKSNGKEKVLNVARQKKIFRASDVEMNAGNTNKYIERLVKDGSLERVGYGLYSLAENDLTENQSLIEVAVKVPTGVFCLLTALSFHDLTTQNPFEVWLAIERKTRYPKIDTVQTRIFRFAPKAYSAGIETHKIEGVKLKVYNPAKTVADCFKYRNKIGLDIAIEALRDTWRKRKASVDELWHYAKICRMSNVMRPYLESLV